MSAISVAALLVAWVTALGSLIEILRLEKDLEACSSEAQRLKELIQKLEDDAWRRELMRRRERGFQ